MTREALHELIDRIPESEIVAVQRALERLARDAAFRSALSSSADDEPVTAGDDDAMARARADVQAGRVVSHDEVLREFGMR
jgi:predicted transcriptional regulator